MELNGKVAWVIGASSGIGAAVARELASRGATVAISARRGELLREVAGGHMLVVPLDITDAASVAAAAARRHRRRRVRRRIPRAGRLRSLRLPFIIDAGAAARSICDGLEHDRTEIVFPARMALLMKAARLVPARAWTAPCARTSLA